MSTCNVEAYWPPYKPESKFQEDMEFPLALALIRAVKCLNPGIFIRVILPLNAPESELQQLRDLHARATF